MASFIAAMRQLALNGLVMLDLSLNLALGGSPRETLSRRTARARAAGSRPACAFCAVLTLAFNAISTVERDHCDWALEGGDGLDREVWHWSPPEDDLLQPPAPGATIAPTSAAE